MSQQDTQLAEELDRLKNKCNRLLKYIEDLQRRTEAAEAAMAAAVASIPEQQEKLLTYASEYVAIVEFLSNKEPLKREKDCIAVSRAELYKLLMKNAYEMPESKLRMWRSLGWIDTDPGRLTRRIRVGGEVVQAIMIRLLVFEALRGIAVL